MSFLQMTPEQISTFDDDGFVVVDGLLNDREIDLLREVARADQQIAANRSSRADGEGGSVDLVVNNDLVDDSIYAAIVRSERIVDTMEELLVDEVYHYHNKMILKEPRVGGAWAWHQDYGYWYNNGCLYPYMASCMIAVDRATRENGCLQVLRGSHLMGRVDHMPVGEQTGADPERVAVALNRHELVYCELEPGSAVFFHCNILHRSDQNTSPDPRWAFIACYNAARNDPYKESRHPQYSLLEKWPHARIVEVGEQHLAAVRSAS
jgi:ectoine hydroxylase